MSAGITTLSRHLLAKVLLTIVVVYLAVGSLAVYWLHDLDSKRHSEESLNRTSQLISSAVTALENLAGNTTETAQGRALVNDILEIFSIEPDILCVEVADQQNALVIAHWPENGRCEDKNDVTRVTVTLDEPSKWQLNVVIGSESLRAEMLWENKITDVFRECGVRRLRLYPQPLSVLIAVHRRPPLMRQPSFAGALPGLLHSIHQLRDQPSASEPHPH